VIPLTAGKNAGSIPKITARRTDKAKEIKWLAPRTGARVAGKQKAGRREVAGELGIAFSHRALLYEFAYIALTCIKINGLSGHGAKA
jgi:hypothetical protein